MLFHLLKPPKGKLSYCRHCFLCSLYLYALFSSLNIESTFGPGTWNLVLLFLPREPLCLLWWISLSQQLLAGIPARSQRERARHLWGGLLSYWAAVIGTLWFTVLSCHADEDIFCCHAVKPIRSMSFESFLTLPPRSNDTSEHYTMYLFPTSVCIIRRLKRGWDARKLYLLVLLDLALLKHGEHIGGSTLALLLPPLGLLGCLWNDGRQNRLQTSRQRSRLQYRTQWSWLSQSEPYNRRTVKKVPKQKGPRVLNCSYL